MATSKIIELDESNTCKICNNALAKYSCPKCNLRYCSLPCYQSEGHLECSESFYKECIVEELSISNDSDESKRKMLEVLQQHNLNAEEAPEEEQLDSDDDSDVGDITARLSGVNLDNADEVWDKLTVDEQQEFIAFLKSDDVSKFVPTWQPWWGYKSGSVEDLDAWRLHKAKCPKIGPIQPFSTLSKKLPADCVRFNLINVLAAYAFIARYFNGEYNDFTDEVTSTLITLSLVLKNNENFNDYEAAIQSIQFQSIQSDWIVADKENYKTLNEDLDQILKGPSTTDKRFYVLCALFDLQNLFAKSLDKKIKEKGTSFSKTFPNDHFPSVKLVSKAQIRSGLRKIDYFLSYTNEFY